MPDRPLTYGSSITENIKDYKPVANIQSYVKDMETTQTNEAVIQKNSTETEEYFKKVKPLQEYLDTLGSATKIRYWRESKQGYFHRKMHF